MYTSFTQAKKTINVRTDLLMTKMRSSDTVFGWKGYLTGIKRVGGTAEEDTVKGSFSGQCGLAPLFGEGRKPATIHALPIDSYTLMLDYTINSEEIRVKEVVTIDQCSKVPSKTVVTCYYKLNGPMVAGYEQALAQAEYMACVLGLLEEVSTGSLSLKDNDLMEGKGLDANYRDDILGHLDSKVYSEKNDVKHFGFLKHQPEFEATDCELPVGILAKVQMNSYEGQKKRTFEQQLPGYQVVAKGGIKCVNLDEIKSQEGIVVDLLKSASKTLLEGRGIIGISLPVRIFDTKTALERLSGYFNGMPYFLGRAAEETNKLERMKIVCAFSMSGYWQCCGQKKPFNPILGETLQAFFEDGTEISMEHTSHHPPISNFHVYLPSSSLKIRTRSSHYQADTSTRSN